MEFYERFKTYSNADLLRIIENFADYQPQAVEAAQNIFSDRQLSDIEIKIAKDELEIEQQKRTEKEQKKKAVEDTVTNVGKSVFDHINPIQKDLPSSERTIRIVTILFSGLFIFQLYKEFGMLRYMFADGFMWGFDASILIYFVPLLLLPTAIILFYLRKKIGWILATIFLIYKAMSALTMVIMAIRINSSDYIFLFIPQISPIPFILSFALFSGIIWLISREKLRTIYSISNLTMLLTISIVTFIFAGIVTYFQIMY